MLTQKRLPLFIGLICLIEILVYLYADWTSTLDRSNFFSIEPKYIFDKSARIAGRISSSIILIILSMLAYLGARKIYANTKTKETFLVLITLFSVNQIIHLLFVFLLFNNYGKSITFDGPIEIGGPLHGFITFFTIASIPFIIWRIKNINNLNYSILILYLFNITGFIVKTFLGKINFPSHPAYHNQFGVLMLSLVWIFIIIRIIVENRVSKKKLIKIFSKL